MNDFFLLETLSLPYFCFRHWLRNVTDTIRLRKCYDDYNNPKAKKNQRKMTYPLCGIQLLSFMHASSNAERCLRRRRKRTWMDFWGGDKQCDPVGDRNVFGFLRERKPQTTMKSSSIIMVTARLDAMSIFEDVAPGAGSPATGIIALLATAHTLARIPNVKKELKDEVISFASGMSSIYANET